MIASDTSGLRILALITDAYGSSGGIARYNRDLLAALSASPSVARVVVLPRLGKPHDEEVPAKVLMKPPRVSRLAFSAQTMATIANDGPFDVVFCGHILLLPLARLVAGLFGKPLWLQVHGIDAWDAPSSLIRRGLEASQLITAVSRYTRRRVLQWAAIEPSRIRVLSNTVRSDIATRRPAPPGAAEHPFEGRRFIFTVSRLNKSDAYKGHGRIISVLPRLRVRHPDLAYVIAGDGDGRGALEQQAREAGVSDMVYFTGHLPDQAIGPLMQSAAAFVMPSTKEGFGIVYLEAAACGLPVIAGNRDGSVDALADGALGMLIDPDEPQKLLEAISRAVAGLVSRPDPGEVEQRFGVLRFNAHVAALIDHLVLQFAAARPTTS